MTSALAAAIDEKLANAVRESRR